MNNPFVLNIVFIQKDYKQFNIFTSKKLYINIISTAGMYKI